MLSFLAKRLLDNSRFVWNVFTDLTVSYVLKMIKHTFQFSQRRPLTKTLIKFKITTRSHFKIFHCNDVEIPLWLNCITMISYINWILKSVFQYKLNHGNCLSRCKKHQLHDFFNSFQEVANFLYQVLPHRLQNLWVAHINRKLR